MVAKCQIPSSWHPVRTTYCRELLCSSFMLWTFLFCLQKVSSVKQEHIPWCFSICKPDSYHPECKLRIPSKTAVSLAAEMQRIISPLSFTNSCFMSHCLAGQHSWKYQIHQCLTYAKALLRILYHVENELTGKRRKWQKTAYLVD